MKKMSNVKCQMSGLRTIGKKGFTLIELLVVIAIIGILATLLMANYIGVSQRSRDALRKSGLLEIRSALELYRSDQNSYPLTAALATCGGPLTPPGGPPPTYMKQVPCDPSGSTYYNSGVYRYESSTGETYKLGACLENDHDPSGSSTPPPGGSGICASGWYVVINNP